MSFDAVNGLVTLPLGLFSWLVALSLFGLFMAGCAFAVAIAGLAQRHAMHKETMRYTRLLEQANVYAKSIQSNGHETHFVTVTGVEGLGPIEVGER